MFLMVGLRPYRRDLGPVDYRTCTHCNNHGRWRRAELSNRLTLFFVPVLTLNRSTWDVCPVCGRGYEVG